MKLNHLVKIDTKGRIVLPYPIRNALNLSEGMNVFLIADLKAKEVKLIPFTAELAEFSVKFSDEPGALAKTAALLAKYGIDLLSSHSMTIERGSRAEWYAIGDLTKCKCTITELKKVLKRSNHIVHVEIHNLKKK